ncbi:putative ABC transporter permease [Eubacterium sp. 1001713B170207_170306_E7]|uniref:putative ABC transporter permease n=1 Tax=Eubacterium sp. 1001713B170207_170306_E7 TaxID=2787097 RepID=UPI00189A9752|nr:putative ABC transporter permease [Eubacterium sp. 1001713B170207_170306_E7]
MIQTLKRTFKDWTASEEVDKNGFAQGLCLYKLFWIFLLGCVLGVIVETLWCCWTRSCIESRSGVLYGPFNPVYGFGAVALTLGLQRLSKKGRIWIFLGSMLLGGAVEYLCSLVQEMSFGTLSWEYSGTFMNLNGRTNLMFAFFWGVLGLLWIQVFYPLLSKGVERIPKKTGVRLTWILIIFMAVNMAVSGLAVARWSERARAVPASNAVAVLFDHKYPDPLMKRVYPNMRFPAVLQEGASGESTSSR